MVGRILAVNVVLDAGRALAFASFGEVEESLTAAVAFAERHSAVPVARRFPVVLSTAAGAPLDATYYQTVKGICTGASILERGGALFVASECREGFGSAEFRRAQERMIRDGPRQFRAGAAGRSHADIDEWQTLMLARALAAGTVHLFSEKLDPADHRLTGAVPETDLRSALVRAVDRSGAHRIAVIPEGPYVLPRIVAAVTP
jgi:nickel-dependent lactate racemase